MQRLFERLDNHWMKFEKLIAELLQERGHWLRFVAGEAPQVLSARVNASLVALVGGRLAALQALMPEGLRRAAAALPGVGELGAQPAALPAWKVLVQLTLTKEDWRRLLSAHLLGADFASPEPRERLRELIAALKGVPGLREALLELRDLPPASLPAADVAALESLSRLLAHAAAELQGQFALAQRVDYTYVTGAAREALTEAGAPTDLALHSGLALRHILVDEFQDTSLAQFELLSNLTAGWEPGDGRTLFVVGDPDAVHLPLPRRGGGSVPQGRAAAASARCCSPRSGCCATSARCPNWSGSATRCSRRSSRAPMTCARARSPTRRVFPRARRTRPPRASTW